MFCKYPEIKPLSTFNLTLIWQLRFGQTSLAIPGKLFWRFSVHWFTDYCWWHSRGNPVRRAELKFLLRPTSPSSPLKPFLRRPQLLLHLKFRKVFQQTLNKTFQFCCLLFIFSLWTFVEIFLFNFIKSTDEIKERESKQWSVERRAKTKGIFISGAGKVGWRSNMET